MAGRNDRWWCTAADLGCLAAGVSAMVFVAGRFDVPRRLLSSSSDPARLQQPMLLLSLIALALVLFGYRRWREVTADRVAASRWAHRDALTGLPDRVVFLQRLQAALDRPGRACVGVLVVDVDGFRLVNVSYGHRAGDDVLASIAERLHAVLGADDLLVRLAGDQFAVLCPNLYDGRHAEQIADRVRQALVRPFDVDCERL